MKPPVPRTRAEVIFCSHGLSQEEWSAWRNSHKSVGASTAPALLGVNKWQGPYTAVKLLRGDIRHEDISGKFAVQLGVKLEPYVLQAVVEHRRPDWVLKSGSYSFRHSKYAWATATPDAFLETAGEIDIPIEVKVVKDFAAWQTFAESGRNPLSIRGTTLYAYWAQVQHQLWVLDAPMGYLVGACGRDLHCRLLAGADLGSSAKDLYIFEIQRDQEWIDAAEKRLSWLWENSVNGDHVPQPLSTDFDAIAKASRFEHGNISKAPECRDDVVRYQAISKQMKELKEEQDNIKARLKVAIGVGIGIEIEEGFTVKNSKPDKRGNRRFSMSQRELS